ncbi:MAG TPA: FliA/WhiG family RNA polymerase sigma factor [Candidatus Methylacidiphilales bacterium]
MGYKNDRVLEYLPWARRFARACATKLPSHLDRDDLQSAGVLGYLRAASRYDVTKGASFRGFCAVRIRGAVLDELRRWDWAPRSVHKNNRRIVHVTSILIEQLEREPTGAELAAALGVEIADLATLQSMAQPRQLVSFDEMSENYHGEENLSLSERLADPSMEGPDAAVLSAEDRKALLKCLGSLPKTQGTVIVLHYLQNMPLREVAALLEVTPSRVSQLHHQALGRLKHAWKRTQAVP